MAAEKHARVALARISPVGWGVAVGLPISVLVLATTAAGKHEDATTHLGMAVPEAMFQTPCGAHYVQARGRHRLATGHPLAALRDFETCAELVRRWGFDVPGLISWRIDQAQVLASVGRSAQATRLATEQLTLLRPGPSRTRGITLRVLATASGAPRREMLTKAVAALNQSGEQYELALVLDELSRAQHAIGEHDQAFSSARSALRLAQQCGLLPPQGTQAPDAEARPSGPAAELTEAEGMVTALAAHGHTNQQIADTLVITVSTVEQHLTRAYRKLRVNRRGDLRSRLRIEPANLVAAHDT